MGEMNEAVIQPQIAINNDPINNAVPMGEQPQIYPEQNVVATQNVGLMENDPFQETTPAPAPAIEVATGATIEEPQPIVEQQIAYNVNVDDVFEGGESKADDITKLVNDVVNNNASILTTPQQVPTMPPAPAIPVPPVQPEPVISLEPGPIAPEQVISSSIEPGPIAPQMSAPAPIEPGPIPVQQPVMDQMMMQQPVPAPMPEQPVAPMPMQDPMMMAQPVPAPQPAMTLEPGPIPSANPFAGVQTNVEIPQQPLQPQLDFQQAEAAPIIDVAQQMQQVPAAPAVPVQAPVVEAPIQQPVTDPNMMQQPVMDPMMMQQPVPAPMPEQAVAPMPMQDPMMMAQPVPAPQPAMTLEPGPIPSANPFAGVQTNVEIPQQPLQPQLDFQQAEAAPIIDVAQQMQQVPAAPAVPVQAPVVEAPIQQPVMDPNMMQQPVMDPNMMQQPVSAPMSEQPVAPMPTQVEFSQAAPAVIEQTPVAEVPSVPVATPEQPVAPEMQQPVQVEVQQPTPEPQPTLSIDEQIIQGNNETVVDTADLVSAPHSINPTPVTVSSPTSAKTVNGSNDNIEEATKTVILQSTPLGKVQPVAPIAVITELIDPPELTKKIEEEKKEELKPVTVVEEEPVVEVEETVEEPVEVEEPEVTEPPVKKEVSIDGDLDVNDEVDSVISKLNLKSKREKKTIQLKSPTEKKNTANEEKIDVESDLFIKLDETAPAKKTNSKRKIIRGEEKFASEKKVVPMEEEPLVKFCPSCGVIVSSDDVVCPECGDPTE